MDFKLLGISALVGITFACLAAGMGRASPLWFIPGALLILAFFTSILYGTIGEE